MKKTTKKKTTFSNWDARMARKYSPAEREALAAEALAELERTNLRALREAAGKTQAEMAELANMAQGEVSRVERREDHRLSTLRRYVEALGGEIEVIAVVNGRRVALQGV